MVSVKFCYYSKHKYIEFAKTCFNDCSKIVIPQGKVTLKDRLAHVRNLSGAIPKKTPKPDSGDRKVEHLNLAHYQQVKLKPHSSHGIPSKRRTQSIQFAGNGKILEKNECEQDDKSMSSYEESIDISQHELTEEVSHPTYLAKVSI